jgi:flagellar hook-length control protein FliK
LSQALPVVPQLPVLDGRTPEPHRRPAEGGDRAAHRHSFGKLLDRFAQRDAAKDTAPEPQREPTADSAAETDDTPRTAGEAQSTDAPADTAVDGGVAPATSDRTIPPEPAAAAAAPVSAPATPERSSLPMAIVLPSPAPTIAPSQPATGTEQPVTPPAASQIPQASAGEPASPESTGPAPLAAVVPETGTLRSPATPTLPDKGADKGAGRPATPSPEITATAAPVLPNASRKPAAGGEPTLAADAAEAVDAALPRPPAAATPSAETAGSDLQSRQDDTAKAGPAIVLTAEQPASAARTAEHPFALTALDSPRGTAALYHKVAETARGRAETPSPADQVSIRVLHAAAEGKRAIQVQLHPAELGSIDVKMHWQGDRLTAQFVVDRPETLELLQRDARALERALGGAGIDLSDSGLSFSLRDQGGGQQEGRVPSAMATDAASLGELQEISADEPLGQIVRDGIISIRV